MQRFKKIGLVLHLEQKNERAIEYALDSARRNEAELFIICAQKQALTAQHRQHVELILQQQVTYPHRVLFLVGQPVVEICRFIANQSIDLLLIEPEEQSGFKQFFFGSLTLSLLRKASCPIWVVKPQPEKTYQRILICVDPVAEDKEKRALNAKLIELGTSLAEREQAECHLATAWYLPGESTLTSPFIQTTQEELEQLKVEQKAKIARAFERLQAEQKSRLHDCITHLMEGEPANAIVSFVASHQIDLVVMGTLARTGVQGFVIGNTAEAMIHQLECSLLAVKPSGFVSPFVLE